jgi:hypothetical protein
MIFSAPRSIDCQQTIERKTPDNWKSFISEPEIDVLPLVGNARGSFEAGWVSIDAALGDSPDIEIFCGGINTKNDVGAALWRQGHLMHFGFEQSPTQMNEIGRAMLVNAIAYIARFHDDQAICRVSGAGGESRAVLEGYLKNEKLSLKYFPAWLEPGLLDGVEPTHAAYLEWFTANRTWLCPGDKGKLAIDVEAKALGVGYDQIEVFDRAVAALADDGEQSACARTLLERRAPEPPGKGADAEAWRAWLASYRPYLFFSERGGYRWYVDELAKERGVPSAELRGPARADAE